MDGSVSTYFVRLEGNIFKDRELITHKKPVVDKEVLAKVNKIVSSGHSIYIVTSRSEDDYTDTLLKLYSAAVPFDKVLVGVPHGEMVVL